MKIRLLFPALLLGGLAHAETPAFKDWVAGCDNTLTCTALGLPSEDGEGIAYVRVLREAGRGAAPSARVVVFSERDEGFAELRVTLDGKPYGGPLKGSADGTWARADLPADEADAFIAALVNASALTVQRVDGGAEDAVAVSLSGSSAALRWMDAQQKRDGGVTAIVAKGQAPATAVPPAPDTPSVTARKMIDVSDTARRPADPALADAEECRHMDLPPIALDLGDGATLWGICAMSGAYNFTYAFHIAGKDGKVTPVPPLPGQDEELPQALALTNPYLTEDLKTLGAFAKARGLGDCGDAQEWAWDGKQLRLVGRSTMDRCRGVSPTEWIVTHRAILR